MIEKISINKDDTNLWPLFFDYDLINKKPRGYSVRLEIFSFGIINKMLLDTDCIDNIVLIKSSKIIFTDGVFLVDYSKVIDNIDSFINNILFMYHGKIVYMAESHHFNIEDYFKFDKKILARFFIFE